MNKRSQKIFITKVTTDSEFWEIFALKDINFKKKIVIRVANRYFFCDKNFEYRLVSQKKTVRTELIRNLKCMSIFVSHHNHTKCCQLSRFLFKYYNVSI